MSNWRLVGLAVLMFMISGVLTTGLQGEFDSLIRHGVFGNKCKAAPPPPSSGDHHNGKKHGAEAETSTTTTTTAATTGSQHDHSTSSGTKGESWVVAESSTSFVGSDNTTSNSHYGRGSESSMAEHQPDDVGMGCHAQQAALTQAINALTSLMNLVALPMGIVVDVLGFSNAALGSTVVWTIFACLSGVAPGIGWIWTISTCICASAGAAIFLSSISGFLPAFAEGDYKIIHRFSSIFTAVWDMSGLLGVAMGYYLKIRGISLFWLFFLYGAAMGIPSCIFMFMLVKRGLKGPASRDEEEKKRVEQEQRDAAKFSKRSIGDPGDMANASDLSAGAMSNEPEKPKVPVAKMMFQVLRTPMIYLLFLEGTWCVTFSYYVLANVEAMMVAKGGAGTDISWAREVIVFAVAGCGVLGFLPGQFVAKVGPTKGVPTVLFVRAVLAAIFIVLVVVGDIAAQFVALFVLGIWRVIGFSVIEGACVGQYVEDFGPILGTIFGLIWTPAGGVSIGLGGWATYLSNQDAKNFTWLASGMAGASIVTSLAFAAVFYQQTTKASQRKEEAEARAKKHERTPLLETA